MSQKGESISKLKNLGPKSEKWLNEIGIYSISDIERVGSVEIYRLLKQNGVAASLNLVYALEGAIIGEHWTALPESLKAELNLAIKNL